MKWLKWWCSIIPSVAYIIYTECEALATTEKAIEEEGIVYIPSG